MQVKPGPAPLLQRSTARATRSGWSRPGARGQARGALRGAATATALFDVAERAEVQSKLTGRPGNIRWYTWSTYIPPSFRYRQARRRPLARLHPVGREKGAAPMSMTVYEGQVVLQVNE